MSTVRDGLARSVQTRLSQHARAIGADPNLVLTRYAVERFLYRLSQSKHADKFVLKGALLMLAWLGDAFRPTRDADLLDMSRPRLRAYTPATVIAEKLHAMVTLGMRNSRLKDYFDLYFLTRENPVPAVTIAQAVSATFQRRNTDVPDNWPEGLTETFARHASKRTQWKAFLDKNRLTGPPLDEAIESIRSFLAEPLMLSRQAGKKP